MQKLLSADDVGAVVALARKAAAEILKVYESEFAVEHKDDDSLLTQADKNSNAIIMDLLPRVGPGWPVLSEENLEDHAFEVRGEWGTYWCVDPLDGTKDFVNRTDEFAINIGLVHNNEAHWGLVLAPKLNACWHGGKAYGAFKRDLVTGEDIPLQATQPAAKPLRALISRNHASGAETSISAAINASPWGKLQVKKHGSSVKYCMIAQGEVDFMPRFHLCSEWDTVAPQAILEGAGGAVLDLTGNPLKYNKPDGLLNPHLVAMADTALPWREWIATRTDA